MFTFAVIYDKYFLRYRRYAYTFVGDWELAFDMVQDCAVKLAHREFPTMHRGFNCGMSYIHNHCYNYREKKRAKVVPIQWDFAADSPAPDALLVKAEVLNRVYEMIEALPQQRREVFKLAYFEDLTNEQIAQFLGLSYHTVKNHLQDAKKQLRIKIIGYELPTL